jgi:hypothetical protein
LVLTTFLTGFLSGFRLEGGGVLLASALAFGVSTAFPGESLSRSLKKEDSSSSLSSSEKVL